MAEAHALSNAVEHGLPTRATIVDIRGQLNIRQWENRLLQQWDTSGVQIVKVSLHI